MKKTFCVIILTALVTGCFCGSVPATEKPAYDFSLETKEALNFEKLLKTGLPVIADYGSEGCGPCRKMYPALEKTNAKYKGRAFVKFADVWKHRKAAGDMPLQVIPTQFFFTAEGKPLVPSEKLAKKFKFLMYEGKDGKHALTAHQGGLSEADFDEILKELGVK